MRPRPLPDPDLRESGSSFAPAPDLHRFIRQAFIAKDAPFWREEYDHLEEARIGVLWTNVDKTKNMVSWAASAELVTLGGDKWSKGRSIQQMVEWFGEWWEGAWADELPDFILTFHGPSAAASNDVGFCAMVAHELRHCAQKVDRWGDPMWNDADGRPQFAIMDHDVSTFVSVAEDFGPVERNVGRLMEALKARPRFPGAMVEGVCGVCGEMAA